MVAHSAKHPLLSIVSFISSLFLLLCPIPVSEASAIPRQEEAGPFSNGTTFDFIIVGGGTAGLALASRLSQRLPPATSILVLEAGPAAAGDPDVDIPGRKGSTIGGPLDWNLTTVPQAGAGGRRWAQTRGRVLGGSSALNLMTWDRGSSGEYDAWAEEVFAGGVEGWGWAGMEEAMLRVENFTRPKEEGVYGERGVGEGGPVQTVINEVVPAQQRAFIPAMEKLGVRLNLESLAGEPLGVMRQPSNVRASDYTRSYSVEYLKVAAGGLRVVTSTTVARVNLAESDGELVATGVTLADGANTTLTAAKEVILSAGSFHSPHLLELSGIGNASILAAAGIAPRVDLPGVGENLQDHVRIQNSYQLQANYTSFDKLRYNATYAAEQLALWRAGVRGGAYDYTGSGYAYLTWAQGLNTTTTNATTTPDALLALARSSADPTSPIDARKLAYLSDPSVPALEIIFSDGYTGARGYPPANSTLYGQGFFTLIGAVQHTFARGSVHVNASAAAAAAPAAAPPVIDPGYLGKAYDKRAVIELAKLLRRVAETEPLRGTWVREYEPGTGVVSEGGGGQDEEDEEWRKYVEGSALSIYHPVGTCAMMARASGGVVDGRLRVHGTKGLRVVDASVIPVQVSAHIQTAVYGIAERAARLVAEDWA